MIQFVDPYMDFLAETFTTFVVDEQGITQVSEGKAMSEVDQETNAMLGKLSEAFNIAKAAIVDNPSLKKQLETMQADMNQLKAQFSALEFSVQGFQEKIELEQRVAVEARRERNDARERIGALTIENSNLRQQIASLQRESNDWQEKFNQSDANATKFYSQLNEAEDNYLKLLDEHDKVKAQLNKIREWVSTGPLSEGTPEPVESASEATPEPAVEASVELPVESKEEPEVPSFRSDGGEQTVQEVAEDTGNKEEAKPTVEGFVWPSMLQPHEPGTGRFAPYNNKKDTEH